MCPEPKILYKYNLTPNVFSEPVQTKTLCKDNGSICIVDEEESTHITIDGLAILTPEGIRKVWIEGNKIIIQVFKNNKIWTMTI